MPRPSPSPLAEIAVFGAAAIGEIMLEVLAALGARVVAVADNSPAKQGSDFFGHTVLSSDALKARHGETPVLVAAERHAVEIRAQLDASGFKAILTPEDIINRVDFATMDPARFDTVLWYLARHGLFPPGVHSGPGRLHMPRLNVVVTSRCTLNCEHCSSLMPYYAEQADFDSTRILRSLERVLETVDAIHHVEILGGEPFLNPVMFEVAEMLIASGKVLRIDVVTNGTVAPRPEQARRLAHRRLAVIIDDYGELSTKKDALVVCLTDAGVGHRVFRHWTWADLGGFEPRGLDEKQLDRAFASCHFNNCTELLDGRLYRCPRSSHGTHLGLIPYYAEDVLDVVKGETDREDWRVEFEAFIHEKTHIAACNHCNGNNGDTLVLEPARQIPRGALRAE